jgi:small subunit ribosomal protein S6
MKRFYECTFIVNPGMDDAQIESTVKMVEDTITKNGGEMVSTENIGRRRLAYPIAKKHNGYYVSLEFEGEGRIIEKVERFLTLDENVMRYLTIALDHRELAAKRARAAFLQEQKEAEAAATRPEGAEAPATESSASA